MNKWQRIYIKQFLKNLKQSLMEFRILGQVQEPDIFVQTCNSELTMHIEITEDNCDPINEKLTPDVAAASLLGWALNNYKITSGKRIIKWKDQKKKQN